jgi:hypothetical protein
LTAIPTRIGARSSVPSEAWRLAALASFGAVLLLRYGPPGTDYAAHAYQTALFADHGFSLWNNYWYSGRYSFITYSTLYYPLAALIGIRALAVLCVGVGVAAFAAVTGRRWGEAARWPTRSIAVMLPALVLTAEFPFLLGAALSLLAILALQARRWPAFAILSTLAAAASPLAFALLGIVALALAAGERSNRRSLVLGGSILAGVTALLGLTVVLFPSQAQYPFPTTVFVEAMAFSLVLAAVTWRVEGARSLRFIAILNGAACVMAFLVSSELGSGMTRLRFFALPLVLLALALRKWRPLRLSIPVLLLVGYWNVAPLTTSFVNGRADASAQAAYWRPAIDFLRSHHSPAYRVEAVDTQQHWAAAYLPAAGFPLVRGWFRQDDFPQNEQLYDPLTASSYTGWLRGLGVRYVVLTDIAPDYSAQGEAALLRSGRSGLVAALTTPHIQIFAVPRARTIVSGPRGSTVVAFGRERFDLRLARPGAYRIAIRYSPYWHAPGGCLSAGRDGMLRLRVRHSGLVHMSFDVGVAGLLRVLAGGAGTVCTPAGGGVYR